MIDAKSILDQLMRGAGGTGQPSAAAGGDDLASLLRRMMGEGSESQGAARSPGGPAQGMSLDEMLRGRPARDQPPPGGPAEAEGQGGGLADILGQFLGQRGSQGAAGGGNLADILGQVFGQATGGVKEGAQRIGAATGTSDNLKDILGQMSGKPPEQMLDELKRLFGQNPLGAAAALGGLGALILGTRSGRSMAAGAARLGALALIGGLAYRAYQNYTQGKAPAAGASMLIDAPPEGSGFEEGAVSNDAATTCSRAMIAAAAADGRFDEHEQQHILDGLKGSGLDNKAESFLAAEIANPASVDDLAALVRRPEEAVQIYAAARLAVEPDTDAENEFLDALANRLGIDPALATHIDTVAAGAAPAAR
jgi:uncharacterized membrane protein YebE (DUF533 family)